MKKTRNLVLILLAGMLVSACGGGGSTGVSSITDTSTTTQTSDTTGTVQQKVNLSWSAPTTRTDGTFLALSELVGYRIYLGTAPDALELSEEIVGVSETAISITDLPPGTYYFAVTAYDADGLESGFSEVVSKQISS